MLRDIANPISNQNRWNSAFEIAMFLILGLGMMVLAPIILSRNIANNFARPSGRRKSMEGISAVIITAGRSDSGRDNSVQYR